VVNVAKDALEKAVEARGVQLDEAAITAQLESE
jgi:hypothetical protein